MKFYRLPRIYIEQNLFQDQLLSLNKEQSHYITKVMRRKISDFIKIFNGEDGEWLAKIININKTEIFCQIIEKIREQFQDTNISLIFSPIKQHRLQFIFEKATELGVSHFIPIKFERTIVDKININKINHYLIESTEQSERLNVPKISSLITMPTLINNWQENIPIIFCNENEKKHTFNNIIKDINSDKIAIMIGPEGGFTNREIEMLAKLSFIKSCTLGNRIMRTETASIASLAAYQAIKGDWNII